MSLVLSVIQVVALVAMLAVAVVGMVAAQTDRDAKSSQRKTRLYNGLALVPFGVFLVAAGLAAEVEWQRYAMVVGAFGVFWFSRGVVRRNRSV